MRYFEHIFHVNSPLNKKFDRGGAFFDFYIFSHLKNIFEGKYFVEGGMNLQKSSVTLRLGL